jgi:glycosyltransferase involved in cell wall biosynthesis
MSGERPPGPELMVVIPVYNEEQNIRSVIEEWLPVFSAATSRFEVVLINDGSRDATAGIIAEMAARSEGKLRAVTQANAGHGRACRTGYELTTAANPDWVLQIDSDGQCDPQYFPKFWELREEADCIFGQRVRRDDGMGRAAISAVCRFAVSLITGRAVSDPNVPYRLIRTPVLRQALKRIPPGFDLQNVALSFVLSRAPGLRWARVPIHFRARHAGKSSINYRQIIRMGLKMLRELRRLN